MIQKLSKIYLPVILSLGLVFGATIPQAAASESKDPKGYWLTEDGDAIVEIVACVEGSNMFCGYIRALPGASKNADLRRYASQICGTSLLSNLSYNTKKKRWDGGQIFDLESEKMYDAFIKIRKGALIVRAYDGQEAMGETIKWKAVPKSTVGC